MELDDRWFIVAGATGGVGEVCARELVRRGASVGLLGRNEPRLNAIADELGGAPIATLDAREVDSCTSAVHAVAAKMPRVDGLVVAIGAVAFGRASEIPASVTAELMAVNVLGPIALLQAAATHLRAGASLVAITAMVTDYPTAGMAAYSASKAALSAYLVALRRELRRSKIHVLDARLPHLDTQFAHHALAGQPPPLPPPHSTTDIVEILADAIIERRPQLSWDLKAQAPPRSSTSTVLPARPDQLPHT